MMHHWTITSLLSKRLLQLPPFCPLRLPRAPGRSTPLRAFYAVGAALAALLAHEAAAQACQPILVSPATRPPAPTTRVTGQRRTYKLPKHPPGPRRCFCGGGACWYCIYTRVRDPMSHRGELSARVPGEARRNRDRRSRDHPAGGSCCSSATVFARWTLAKSGGGGGREGDGSVPLLRVLRALVVVLLGGHVCGWNCGAGIRERVCMWSERGLGDGREDGGGGEDERWQGGSLCCLVGQRRAGGGCTSLQCRHWSCATPSADCYFSDSGPLSHYHTKIIAKKSTPHKLIREKIFIANKKIMHCETTPSVMSNLMAIATRQTCSRCLVINYDLPKQP